MVVDNVDRVVVSYAGIPPSRLMAYMLVGFDRRETGDRVLYHFHRMADIGIKPFPIVYGERRRGLSCDGVAGLSDKTLGQFQRWAVRRFYNVVPFAEYDTTKHALVGRVIPLPPPEADARVGLSVAPAQSLNPAKPRQRVAARQRSRERQRVHPSHP